MRAIEYVSYADAVGYGIAAVGYVRLLVEAGSGSIGRPILTAPSSWRASGRRLAPPNSAGAAPA